MPRGRRGTARRKSKAVEPSPDEAISPEPEDAIMSTTETTGDMATTSVDSETLPLSNDTVAALPPLDADEKSQPFLNANAADSSHPLPSTSGLPESPSKASLDSLLNPDSSMNGAGGNPFHPFPTLPIPSTSQQLPPTGFHGPQDIESWRQAEIDKRQAEITAIVDRHDDHVRELFHLDRFVTLVGFDPAVAKQDRSDVFQSFQANYDLFLNAAPDVPGASNGRRGTRRANAERKLAGTNDVKGKGRAREDSLGSDSFETGSVRSGTGGGGGGGGRRRPGPNSLRGRASMTGSPVPQSTSDSGSPAPRSKPRPSLALSTAARIEAFAPYELDSPYVPVPFQPLQMVDGQYPLKHVIPPPSPTTVKRRKLIAESDVLYSHPLQRPPDPKFEGSLTDFLSSFISLEDDIDLEPPPPEEELEARAENELEILAAVEAIRAEGRQLYDPEQGEAEEWQKPKDHQDWLVEHAVYFAGLVAHERKTHVNLAKKMARMITKHFEEIHGKQDRELREIEKNQKALARWTVREIKKKWKLAIGVVRAKRKAALQEEQKRLGKEQLDKMLNKSTSMLQAQQVEMAGEESGTDEESAAEESSEEEEEGEESENEEDQNSTGSPAPSTSVTAESSPAPTPPSIVVAGRRRPPRSRSRLSVSVTPAQQPEEEEEGEEGDVGFAEGGEEDVKREQEDDAFAAEMEKDDEGDNDNELGDLAAEAEMPIEELLRRSGYAAMMAEEAGTQGENGGEAEGDDASMQDAIKDEEETTNSTRDSTSAIASSSTTPNAEKLTAEEVEAEAMSEFGSDGEDEREDEDAKLAKEMEEEERDGNQSDDSEMAGLQDEAEMPIEELMKKYGYGGGGGEEVEENSTAEQPMTNGTEEPSSNGADDAKDEELEAGAVSEKEEEEEEEVEEIENDREPSPLVKAVHLQPPFLLRATLRPYQQAGLEWLASLYAGGVNGVLADEMGLGKTIQTISLLAHLACDKGQWGPHLVVVPTSVMLNWEMEFRKFLPGFKLMVYYGTQKERKEKRKGWNTENAFHVCITSYQLVLADQHIFRRKPWHYLILDEAHHIKNFRSQRWQTLLGFNARHRLLLTGTPLQNNLMELWSLLYFLMPHGLTADGSSGPFADHADFQAWFSNPMEKAIEQGETMDKETQATVSKLHTILRPYLLRRLKAEVETQMPGKTESIIYCRLSKRQRFLYDDFMSRAQTRETLGSGHFLSIINCLMQLRKVCNHPDLFEVRPVLTSFSMTRSVATNYEPQELLVRKRLLAEEPIAKMDWSTLTLVKPEQEESTSSIASHIRLQLDASASFSSLHQVPIDVDLSMEPPRDTQSIAGWRRYNQWSQHRAIVSRLDRLAAVNSRRTRSSVPYFGHDLLHFLRSPSRENALLPVDVARPSRDSLEAGTILPTLIRSYETRAEQMDDIVSTFSFVTPTVKALDMPRHALPGVTSDQLDDLEEEHSFDLLHNASTKNTVAFPDRSLLQYDCGKLQKLDELLRECKAGGHRVLIFTQMTKVLDILEEFLSYQGHRYLRLDGSTKIEQRQILTERFNSNDKILCFISSTRSGGLGINLQGADTVIFYDSDWNPALDRQCQDRAHRIGQTREVRIWRFVTEHSIEENMLKKANQKRRLDEMVIAEGDFTTDYLQKLDWRDYLDDGQLQELGVDAAAEQEGEGKEGRAGGTSLQSAAEIRQALAAAEDEEDAAAAKAAVAEMDVDRSDFAGDGQGASTVTKDGLVRTNGDGVEEVEEEDDPLKGTVDGFMVHFVEDNWELFD
ncbi:chromatin-remodeling protein SWR1 [Sporobolomyces salmoneus]|uniref:chromatin-remodeling protein SWR1 n=1 Tax=Sporobolomyces salmoneus TaxID=183962 RepID=UPI00317F6E8E